MKTPALLTKLSIHPNRSSVCSTTRRAVSASVMSPEDDDVVITARLTEARLLPTEALRAV